MTTPTISINEVAVDTIVINTTVESATIEEQTPVTIEISDLSLVKGLQGIKGDKGDPGDSNNLIIRTASIAMSSYRAVVSNGDGKLKYADKDTAYRGVIGITTTAADANSLIDTQTFGSITEPTWNWNINLPIWLSNDGHLTQTIPTSGAIVTLAAVLSPTEIFVTISDPIVLA